jgi:hypothetical protein
MAPATLSEGFKLDSTPLQLLSEALSDNEPEGLYKSETRGAEPSKPRQLEYPRRNNRQLTFESQYALHTKIL